jgi:hypothetical protein
MSLEDSMTVMFMVQKNLIKKRFKAKRIADQFRQEPAKLLLQSLWRLG